MAESARFARREHFQREIVLVAERSNVHLTTRSILGRLRDSFLLRILASTPKASPGGPPERSVEECRQSNFGLIGTDPHFYEIGPPFSAGLQPFRPNWIHASTPLEIPKFEIVIIQNCIHQSQGLTLPGDRCPGNAQTGGTSIMLVAWHPPAFLLLRPHEQRPRDARE